MDREALAFERLHRLASKGYVPELGRTDELSITLRHPAGAPALRLHPEGEVESIAPARARRGRPQQLAIPPGDDRAFYGFLDRIPDAGPRKRSVWRKLALVIAFALFWLLSMALTTGFLENL